MKERGVLIYYCADISYKKQMPKNTNDENKATNTSLSNDMNPADTAQQPSGDSAETVAVQQKVKPIPTQAAKLKDDNNDDEGGGSGGGSGSGGSGNDNGTTAKTDTTPFIDIVYEKVNAVLGGSDPHQYLCLTIPGQALSAEDFAYDYKNNQPKGPVVEANESRLANKLFDPCRMTGADNGLTLPYQYQTALDMLSPMLNGKIAEAKNQLRMLLMTEYAYDFGDGSNKTYTLQEVFFKLYDDWVAVSKSWAEEQSKKKDELRQSYPADSEGNIKYNDEYLRWYEDNAYSRINEINEKLAKVISVFTPNDMEILEGVLDSGSGAELQEARLTLLNTRKITPDGGYIYPVKLNPTNWFELLSTSFTPTDLLKDPDVLAMQMQSLSARRMQLNARISEITSLIPDPGTLKKLQKDVADKKLAMDTAYKTLTDTYGTGIQSVINTVFDLAPLFVDSETKTIKMPAEILTKLASGAKLSSGQTLSGLVTALTKQLSAGSSAQQDYVNAVQNLTDASASEIAMKNLTNLGSLLSPLQEQVGELTEQIDAIKTQIQVSNVLRPAPDSDGNVKDADTSESAVTPSSVPEGYTQIVISASASNMDKETKSNSHASAHTAGLNFWFAGAHSSSSESSSSFSSQLGQSDATVQIGMNVAKVGIEREWFNPGVFYLTKDMFNVTTNRISPNPAVPYTSVTDARLKDMANNGVFPCYPVAFVVARDISIKIVSNSSLSTEFADSMEKHASTGGGFLFFSGSTSTSSSSSESAAHFSSTSNSITLKFSTPQIIGYYMQATAADKSTYLDNISRDADQAGYVTISEFAEKYRTIIEEYNKSRSKNRRFM